MYLLIWQYTYLYFWVSVLFVNYDYSFGNIKVLINNFYFSNSFIYAKVLILLWEINTTLL